MNGQGRRSWYQDAVFYELPVKAFFDANQDGIGDFQGLTRKLDYLVELGVNCVWLLPFCASPWKDDGYDVSDFRQVHPAYGTIEDFREFLREAHRRELRVAAEMVINHTSDQHPWFQAAQQAPAHSPLRDFYVWSDTPERFREAEIRFHDVQRSNWTWVSPARAFYWHRFYDHQPDLNYDNPAVRQEMLSVLRFWADLGVDGLCLNGAPYLCERDGTPCEHLPQTHEVLQEFRRQLQGSYPELMLQAGVNAWPGDARQYFGNGDQCHTVPHLPLAQRMFLALRQEDRHPIEDILRQTPELPAGCQWITLLRNHDELTLSLATDEERDYLYREYAAESTMRRHAGILRRLATLADNSRPRIELLLGLLFSLPGSPMIYYGDEIGMGDNVYLGGRSGIRTPMQWSSDHNAGFSQADFARLYAPPVVDPVYGYRVVNVAAQQRSSSSLLQAVRRYLALRKRSASLSRGDFRLLEPDNRKVLAFVRCHPGDGPGEEERVLVVANLSRAAQPVQLDLSAFSGLLPIESLGQVPFPRIGTEPYFLSLGPHAIHWFQLRRQFEPVASRRAPVATAEVAELPALPVPENGAGLWEGPSRQALEQQVLPGFLASQRWFGGKSRRIESVRIVDWAPVETAPTRAFLVFMEVQFSDGSQSLYFVPLAIAPPAAAARLLEHERGSVVARLAGTGDAEAEDPVLFDALSDPALCQALLDATGREQTFNTQAGSVHTMPTEAYAELRGSPPASLRIVRGPATSSNSLVFYGRRLLFKLFRRLESGTNPDVEIGRFLTEHRRFDRVPRVAGTWEYQRADGSGPFTLGILQEMVPNQGDGWEHAIGELGRYYDRAMARAFGPDSPAPDRRPLLDLAEGVPPPALLETINGYLNSAAVLARRTAQMHRSLAADPGEPDFAPATYSAADLDQLRHEVEEQRQLAFSALEQNLERLPAEIAPDAQRLLEQGSAAIQRVVERWSRVPETTKIRIHGDYHLGQVLWVENDYVILDFEGEPTRTVEARRQKFSPLRDVAGMLRSYHYAAYAALFAFTRDWPQEFARLVPWAELWQQWVSATFLCEYLAEAGAASFVPRERAELAPLLDGFMLAKALYELAYELNNRPDWVRIPLGGVLSLLDQRA